MSSDAHDSSLSERIRSQSFAPGLQEVLAELAEQVEANSGRIGQMMTAEQIIARARTARTAAELTRASARARRPARDRHGLHVAL